MEMVISILIATGGAIFAVFIMMREHERRKDEIIAAVRGYSEIEQRKLDEIVGLIERTEQLVRKNDPDTIERVRKIREAVKRPGPPVIQDFEASQKATLEEYREQ